MLRITPPPPRLQRSLLRLLVIVLFAWPVFGEVIEIEPGASIQAALRAALDGTVIRLLPGVYRENLQISGSATLLGDPEHPESVVLEGRIGPVVMISGGTEMDCVRIGGMTIRGGRGYLPDGILYTAAAALACDALVIERCERNGITASGMGCVTVNSCTFRDNGRFGLDVAASCDVAGASNTFVGNSADLSGFADPALRTPVASQTSSRIVRVPEHYATIQAAIDAVPAGGTVRLGPGAHAGGVTVWKDVTLAGEGITETELVGGTGGSVTLSLLSSAGELILRSMTVRTAGMTPIIAHGSLAMQDLMAIGAGGIHNEPAFAIQGSGRLNVRDSIFESIGGVALQATGGCAVSVEECRFEGNHKDLYVQGSRWLDLVECTFTGAREQSITVSDATFSMEGCEVGTCLEGIDLVGAAGTIHNCSIHDVGRWGLGVYGASEVLVSGTCWASGGGDHVRAADDAAISLVSCEVNEARGAGVVATGASTFHVQSSSVVSNGGAGLIASGQSIGDVIGCSIEDNGLDPVLATFEGELYAGGILVSGDAQLTVRDSTIRGNGGGGILLDPLDPLSDEALDINAFTGRTFLPIANVVDCTISENEHAGISVRSYGRLTAESCVIAANVDGSGILLDGTGWVASGTVGATFHLSLEQTDGVDATISGCTLRNHIAAGVQTFGGASAELADCMLSENSIGILMDVRSWVDLHGNDIVRNITYGIAFADEACTRPMGMCPPKQDHLTGFGNVIPESDEEDGNGIRAFTTGEFPCLTQPEGCLEKK